MNNTEGKHILIELTAKSTNSEFLNQEEILTNTFEKYIKESGAILVNKYIHKFEPSGFTGMFVLAESHLSFHTWPDQGYASIDFYTCGKANPEVIISGLIKDFECTLTVMAVNRGCRIDSRFFSNLIWHKDLC